jgi:hypothetical protein
MKKLILLIALLLGGVAAIVAGLVGIALVIRRLLPSNLRQRLFALPGRAMSKMIEHMPDD